MNDDEFKENTDGTCSKGNSGDYPLLSNFDSIISDNFNPNINPNSNSVLSINGYKSLEEHQRDIEPIIEKKSGLILGKEWRYVGKNKHKTPFFYIQCECEEKHTWWAGKYDLMPRKKKPCGSWCPNHRIKTLKEHQEDIEPIVKKKGGKIVGKKWKYYGKQKTPVFNIECDKEHRWWIIKGHILPSKINPDGSWCPDPHCRGKSLKEHQKDIELIVKRKGGKILESKWLYTGKKKDRKTSCFLIICDKGHKWWVLKQSLLPSYNYPDGSWCLTCFNKSLEEHQKDIEPIVKKKGGKILNREWRYIGRKNHKVAYFHILCNNGHRWWVSKQGLIPNKSNPKGTWCKICQDRIGGIGILGHYIIEYCSLKYLLQRNCKVVHEEKIEENFRPDLIIERNYNFKKKIEAYQDIICFSSEIKLVIIDFTLSLNPKVILEKALRSYQDKNRFLIIVLLRKEGTLNACYFQNLLDNDINISKEDKNVIKIINFEEYLAFLNLNEYLELSFLNGQLNIISFENWNSLSLDQKEIVLMLLKIQKLSIDSIKDDSTLDELIFLSEKYSKLLRNEFGSGIKSF